MPREILDPKKIHTSIQKIVSEQHADIIAEVKEAIAKNTIVIVVWRKIPPQNEHVRYS